MTCHPRHPLSLALLSSLCWAAATTAQAAMTFTTLQAPVFGGAPSAVAMNNARVAVGTADFPVGFFGRESRAATWATGTGATASPTSIGKALVPVDLNETGVIAGNIPLTPAVSAAGVLDHGTVKKLHPTDSVARAINAQGWVVGNVYLTLPPNGQRRTMATLWHDGLEVTLATPDGWNSEATGLNNAGQAVGTLTSPVGEQHAVRWVNGAVDWTGPDRSSAAAINGSGQVLVNFRRGYSNTSANTCAVWNGSDFAPVAPTQIAVSCSAMNASGDVVGLIQGHPFIWKNGVFHDLAQYAVEQGAKVPSNAMLGEVLDINDLGDILVRTYLSTLGSFSSYGSARLNVTR
jgi:uncharacterized membrane protein